MLFLISELSKTQNSKLQESGTSEFYLGLKLTREMALFFTLFDVPRRFVCENIKGAEPRFSCFTSILFKSC